MEHRRISRETVYEGRIVRLHRDRVAVRRDGGPERVLTLEHIEHPGAACAVAFLDEERILLLRQFRYSAGGELWELPAGKLDGPEPPEDCIRRELVEETGWHPRQLRRLSTLVMTPGFCDERITVFEATELERREASVDDDEFLETVTVPFREAVEMVRSGEIQDSKTVAGLLLAALRRGL